MSALPYNLHAIPQWNPVTQHAPWSQPSNTGYDPRATQLSQSRRNAAYKRANGNLCDGFSWWPLFVHDIQIDLALAGADAQARFTKDFYPRNFTQPTFQISGQCLDQEEYGHLTEWVHQSQRNALANNKLTQLFIIGWGYDGHRNSGSGVTLNGKGFPNQMIRGSHSDTLAMGYVGSLKRTHKQGVYAPTWTVGFVVAELLSGPYQDGLVQAQKQQTWVDILKSTQNLTTTSALQAENQANLKWATDNSINILNSGQGQGSV